MEDRFNGYQVWAIGYDDEGCETDYAQIIFVSYDMAEALRHAAMISERINEAFNEGIFNRPEEDMNVSAIDLEVEEVYEDENGEEYNNDTIEVFTTDYHKGE